MKQIGTQSDWLWPPVTHTSLLGQYIALLIVVNETLIIRIVLWMRPTNQRRRYNVTQSHIGWAHAQDDLC